MKLLKIVYGVLLLLIGYAVRQVDAMDKKLAQQPTKHTYTVDDVSQLILWYRPVAELEKVINAGVDVNAYDAQGLTPLMIASGLKKSNPAVIKFFLEKGADSAMYSANCIKNGIAPLHFACLGDFFMAAVYIVAHGADINLKEQMGGRTALHIAASKGNNEIVRLLLNKKDIKINEQDNVGCTPLYNACEFGQAEVLDLLLEKGADPTLCTHTKCAPGMILLRRHEEQPEKCLSMLQKLQAKGVSFTEKDMYGQSYLNFVSLCHYEPIIKFFLHDNKNNDCINAKNNVGVSPLNIAVFQKNVIATKLLVEHRADVNSCDNKKITVLMYAAFCPKNDVVVDYLLKEGAYPGALDTNGNSALFYAALSKDLKTCELLLKKTPVHLIYALNKRGISPMKLAQCGNNHVLRGLFLKYYEKSKPRKSKAVQSSDEQQSIGTDDRQLPEYEKSRSQGTHNNSLDLTSVSSRFEELVLAEAKHKTKYTYAGRYLDWFDQKFLNKKREQLDSSLEFEQQRRYHQIPQSIIEILNVFGMHKSQEAFELQASLEGEMQFENPENNPWNPKLQKQQGIYHFAQSQDGVIYHVGFKPYAKVHDKHAPRPLSDYFLNRTMPFTKKDMANIDYFAFWVPENDSAGNGVRHIVYRY